jgi:hypothetical protein
MIDESSVCYHNNFLIFINAPIQRYMDNVERYKMAKKTVKRAVSEADGE